MTEPVSPLVSVVIPYFNHGKHLHQAVHSCLHAYKGPLDIVIVNDGSVEAKATHYLKAACETSSAVRVVEQSNQGLSAARNLGVKSARGAFVQLLDSDDLLSPGKLDLQLDHFAVAPQLDVSLTNYLLCDGQASRFWRDGDPITRFDFNEDDFLFRWERGFSLPIHAALFRREVLEQTPFEIGLHGKEDWVFWCALAHARRTMSYIPVFGAVYRQHVSMSKSFRAMGQSWLDAAKLVEKRRGQSSEAFRTATAQWYDTFYRPRIAEEKPSATEPGAGEDASEEAPAPWPPVSPAMVSAQARGVRFSIVVPVFNHYRYLRECLDSLLTQDAGGGFEIVIADDASSDVRVRPVLMDLARQHERVHLILNDYNAGIAETLNRAGRRARGEFLVFVDCDDSLPPGALKGIERGLPDGADYLFTDRIDIDSQGKRIRLARYGGYANLKPTGDVALDLLDGMVASHAKVVRRSAFFTAGGFDEKFSGVQDWELALRMADAGARFTYLPLPLYNHRLHSSSVTGDGSVRQFWLSNVVRRRFARLRLRPDLTDDAALLAARGAVSAAARGPLGIRTFNEANSPTPALLKQAWRRGELCVYASGSTLEAHVLALLREYNAYFDAILTEDEESACGLVGYMWDPRALVLQGAELSNERFQS